MENLRDNVTSRNIVPLFIQEGDDASNEATSENLQHKSAAQSNHIFVGEFLDQTMSISQYLKEMDDLLKSSEGITCSQEYMSTNSRDTVEDISEVQLQSTSFSSAGEGPHTSSSMPLTSVGNKLSESMVEYEGQLSNMLDMLESCVEDSNMVPKPQDNTPLHSQEEYVHIPKLFKETAKTRLEPSKAMVLEAHAGGVTLSDHQENTAEEVYVRKKATRAVPQSVCTSHKVRSLTEQYPEKRHDVGNTLQVQDDSSLEWTKNEQIMCEKTWAEEEHSGAPINVNRELNEVKVDMIGLNFGMSDFETLGSKLDKCIDEVQSLLQKQRELKTEVMELRGNNQQKETIEVNEQACQADTTVEELITRLKKEEDLKREQSQSEIETLRLERAEEERKLWRVCVERQGLHNELWRLKRKLFVIARECAQSHAAQGAQQRHIEQLKKEEEELQTTEVQLWKDSEKMQQEHKQQLVSLQEQLNVATSSLLTLTPSRSDSCGDVQQYLQDSLKAQEERYGPILMALLKRRDTAMEACAKVKEQTQELRVQMTPLREEIQKLTLQKVCLDEKLKLISFQRKEKMGQYKEIVDSLEERCRELKADLRIQKAKTNEMKELKEMLNAQLTKYRSAIESHINNDNETT